ncbi:MOSC domain-containing protein [Rhizobium sp. P38BS-XIX]|uniref:MOSC domain-containing protein n=1 Tax=Rhizobium sp. P38BS-XIX TaxID=2726740 RepID=UPI0014572F9C|nr:MOSC domain-containing protein [Rhizobium sp. P38BS-XIX]NLS01419.1 MOSC domain-containing protein [Rhizobium sp. P38BS-XIX]
MKILAVCRGAPETLPGRKTKTGINKHAVSGAVMIDEQGLLGDAICNRKHHGGRDQAVYVEGSLTLDWWAGELGCALEPGAFGENLIIEGLDNRNVAVGDKFIAGDLVLEVTSARIPCSTFAAKRGDPHFVKRYTRAGRPGIYCRVLESGTVSADMQVSYMPYEGGRVTMPEMMATFGRRLSPEDRSRYLAAPIHYKLRALIESEAAA